MRNVEQRFGEALTAVCGFRPGEPLLAGFSGGVDSTALVLLLWRAGVPFTAVHLQHGLRGAAGEADAVWCAEFCGVRKLPFELHELRVPQARRPGEGMEAAARRCRLEFWRGRLADGQGSVALGQQADDCLEELLLRLARGANASGLTGLRPVRTVCGVRLIRPLLAFRRSELEAYVLGQGVVDWRHDASNQCRDYRRNAVRHDWLPAIRRTCGGDASLLRSLEALRQDADFLEAAAVAALPVGSELDAFRRLPPALLPRVLRLWWQRETGLDMPPRRQAVERLAAELARPDGEAGQVRLLPLGGGWRLALVDGCLRVCRPLVRYDLAWDWHCQPRLELAEVGVELTAERVDGSDVVLARPHGAGEEVVYFPAASLPSTLRVKSWSAGDRLVPFGHGTDRKLKDLFSAAGIEAGRRSAYPLVLAGDQVIWAAGLRRSAWQPVAEATLAAEAGASVIRLTRWVASMERQG